MMRRAWWTGSLLLLLIVTPWLVDLRPNEIDLANVLQPPSTGHLLGTGENGRDALSRLLTGAQLTLRIGAGSTALAITPGGLLGTIAGSVGGAVDDIIMRATDLALALPALFGILIVSTLIEPGILHLIILIGLTEWMPVAHVVRGAAREISTRQFVIAAASNGASQWRIVRNHIVPNLRSVLAVTATLQLSRAPPAHRFPLRVRCSQSG